MTRSRLIVWLRGRGGRWGEGWGGCELLESRVCKVKVREIEDTALSQVMPPFGGLPGGNRADRARLFRCRLRSLISSLLRCSSPQSAGVPPPDREIIFCPLSSASLFPLGGGFLRWVPWGLSRGREVLRRAWLICPPYTGRTLVVHFLISASCLHIIVFTAGRGSSGI